MPLWLNSGKNAIYSTKNPTLVQLWHVLQTLNVLRYSNLLQMDLQDVSRCLQY